jgi:PPK2 family polyphosphate:nucleotide phosphotransferase
LHLHGLPSAPEEKFAGAQKLPSDPSESLNAAFDQSRPLERYIAPPGRYGRIDLSKLDPSDSGKFADDEAKAVEKLKIDQEKLDSLQQVLYAEGKRRVLIVLQAMDTGGKDGVIRHVMRSLNPQGVQVSSFKKPTDEERAHPWLWRIQKALPKPGMIGIFNRSHYEDILVPSVYKTFSRQEIESRYGTINEFERQLAAEGVTILKFFLYISKDEQKARLQARLDDPDKNWKFSEADLKSRAKWPAFMRAYERILARTNTAWAPWYIIPANNKWYRDYLIGRILRKTLQRLDPKFPPAPPDLGKIKIPD